MSPCERCLLATPVSNHRYSLRLSPAPSLAPAAPSPVPSPQQPAPPCCHEPPAPCAPCRAPSHVLLPEAITPASSTPHLTSRCHREPLSHPVQALQSLSPAASTQRRSAAPRAQLPAAVTPPPLHAQVGAVTLTEEFPVTLDSWESVRPRAWSICGASLPVPASPLHASFPKALDARRHRLAARGTVDLRPRPSPRVAPTAALQCRCERCAGQFLL